MPWAILLGLVLLTGMRVTSETELILIWLAISVLNNLFVWVAAVRGLHSDFRTLATRPWSYCR